MNNPLSRLRAYSRQTLAILALSGIASAVLLIFFASRINNSITAEKESQSAADAIEVEETRLSATASDGRALYINAADARAVARFNGSLFLATSGGLIELDPAGGVKRRYTTLDGLPDNDLTALAVFSGRLFVGTATRGLVSFDGNRLTGFAFKKPKAGRVSALVSTDSELLIGTLDGGLFEYDGERFTRRFNSATGADFSRVTAILPLRSRLYVGTQDRGLYIWREGHVERIGTNEGLPSPHVSGLSALPEGLHSAGAVAVATDFGVVSLTEQNEMTAISDQPNVTSLAAAGGRLWGGLFTGGIVELSPARKDGRASEPARPVQVTGIPASAPAIAFAGDGVLWALTGEGAFKRGDMAERPAMEAVGSELVRGRVLAGAHVTGLAFDAAGRLWIGYFDRGADIVLPETGERLSHLEDDRVREVNFIRFDADDEKMLVATSKGLVIFDGQLRQVALTRDQSGVINDSVAHVSLGESAQASAPSATAVSSSRSLVLATAGGLSEVTGGRTRSITAFHGLASNHLYTSARANGHLYLGSLAGLAELEGLRVVRTYKTSNSPLSHDWVTALSEVEGSLFIGTNGGGVDQLLATGEWVNFSGELGKFEVNQNAMHFDGERLYVGTGDRGILIYNTRARLWTRLSAGLPSQSVTAITSDARSIFVGTMNGLMRIEKRVIE
jgi:ligand-binding sensor domain-containing protein